MDVRLRRISSLLGWTFELALALPISRRRFESRLVGLTRLNCELFAGRSLSRDSVSRPPDKPPPGLWPVKIGGSFLHPRLRRTTPS